MAGQSFLPLFLMLTLHSALPFSYGETTLCVLSSGDSNTESEDVCGTSVHCSKDDTIELEDINAISERSMEINVHLCSAEYNSSDVPVLLFANLLSVTITGSGSRLICQNEESGLRFKNVTRIAIRDIVLNQCGFLVSEIVKEIQSNGRLTVGVYIVNSANISISNVTVQGSPGIGLLLWNNSDYIDITHSRFNDNCAPNFTNPGGGVVIGATPSQSSEYSIFNCSFTNNSVQEDLEGAKRLLEVADDAVVCGEGLNVFFQDETSMVIEDSIFTNNSAIYGGALYLSFANPLSNARVEVNKCHFQKNSAIICGGAVSASYIQVSQTGQMVRFFFTGNVARYSGGGVYMYNHFRCT